MCPHLLLQYLQLLQLQQVQPPLLLELCVMHVTTIHITAGCVVSAARMWSPVKLCPSTPVASNFAAGAVTGTSAVAEFVATICVDALCITVLGVETADEGLSLVDPLDGLNTVGREGGREEARSRCVRLNLVAAARHT